MKVSECANEARHEHDTVCAVIMYWTCSHVLGQDARANRICMQAIIMKYRGVASACSVVWGKSLHMLTSNQVTNGELTVHGEYDVKTWDVAILPKREACWGSPRP
jgi:hypothetical protein